MPETRYRQTGSFDLGVNEYQCLACKSKFVDQDEVSDPYLYCPCCGNVFTVRKPATTKSVS